ncbi:MAG: OmpA family protein [Deltaproteobacteria bacterium]|nr:OmpA family protein [Deltaproteobacteria bacterium]
MYKRSIGTLGLFLATTLLIGCATMYPPQTPLTFTPQKFDAGKYNPKVDNFQIIIDASESMDLNNYGEQEYPTARNFVSSVNQSIPAGLNYNAGLRSFGHHPKQSKEPTALAYGMAKYSRSGFAAGLDGIKHLGGVSPLSAALAAAATDLKGASGNSAIVVVSDGVSMEDSPAAASLISKEMGGKLCVYTVLVGNSAEGRKTLGRVAKAFQCGKAFEAADLTDSGRFANFVETVFLAPGKKAPVLDSDRDGVPDNLDKCPGTPWGVKVDADGCPIQFTLNIQFASNRADILPAHHGDLANGAKFIKENPGIPRIIVAGHTDSIGSDALNQALSQRRAEAVRQYLIQNHNIDGARLAAQGFGESRPVAANDTAAGRQMNRRVEIYFASDVTE